MNQQKDKPQKPECSPISEQNDFQDTTQKRDFPELNQLYREKEDLIKWLLDQLQIAQRLCTQIVTIKNKDQIQDFQELKRILDESLEKAKNQGYSQETSVNPFDSPPKYISDKEIIDSDIKTKSQNKFINNPSDTKLISNTNNHEIKCNNLDYLVGHRDNQQKIYQNTNAYNETLEQSKANQQEDFNQENGDEEFGSSCHFINSSYELRAKESFMRLKQNQLKLSQEYLNLQREFIIYKEASQKFIQNDVKLLMQQFKIQISNQVRSQPQIQNYEPQSQEITIHQNRQIESQANHNIYYLMFSNYKETLLQLRTQFESLKQGLINENQKLRLEVEKELEKFKEKLQSIFKQNQSNITKIKDLSDNLSIKHKENEDLKKSLINIKKELDVERQNNQELQNRFQEQANEAQLGQFNDSNVYSLLKKFEQNQRAVCQNGNEAFEKLQMMEELNQQVTQIKKAVMKDYETQIENQDQEIKKYEMRIKSLQVEKKQLEENIRQNNLQGILNDTLQKVSDQEKKNYELSIEISKKANQITFLKEQIQTLNDFVQGKQNEIRKQLMEEYKNIMKLQLEGCYTLQQQSILFNFLGLKIFRQYIISENSNRTQIDLTMEKLNQFNLTCQKKENQKLMESKEIERFYKDYYDQLKDIYEETLQQFKRLLKEIQERRIKAQ
ncbi:unnamed protein product (macronuclear) [Paramecium tetraurelia]|uniref:Uncharacterized protein n=1 Tax=Paramecium tetraurelia TaxID=5888 RepID=A0DPI3_PARTE|nr:uncharacterized protein GSPATT00019132001 [Paramecium tetraurelia]CAK84950.1 unnamed protein product [Paramecium tetraurelia]|eukprot:XP_001452347.1 hypothetical protein (macronuclear) [Paramecium tetraurelia strain d4-2]